MSAMIKPWKKIVLIVVVAGVLLFAAGMSIYKFVIIPKYIEPVLISASSALRDSDVQDIMIKIAQELEEKGVIDKATLRNYTNKANQYSNSVNYDMDAEPEYDDQGRASTTKSENDTVTAKAGKSSIGIKTIKVNDSDATEGASSERYSQEFNMSNSAEQYISAEEKNLVLDKNGDNTVTGEISSSRANSLYNRIMDAMTAHEKSVFFGVLAKADTSELLEVYKAGDKSDAKEYLQSILSSAEYSEAVSIFYKYAPMLME